ncbi:protein yippee-like 4 isoform X2 [Tympanuchus pallidicinctus]|uniref:protein yippee-like 4 isoform X2 n=1 Tax=Tympanuchus pallidicinctus TaxID=109042 RepID=UPI0022871BC1|nr:protein yippee-like 4 isoform X2 [Tympanuchus pallidicinctus]
MPPAPPRPPGALPPAVLPARRHRVPATTRLPPRTFHSYLPRSHRTYSCVHCRAHLARHEELISKSFQGSHGRAYLFNSVTLSGAGLMWAVARPNSACCSLGFTLWLTSSARTAKPPWAGNTSRRSRAARSTRRGSSSSRCRTWSRRTAGIEQHGRDTTMAPTLAGTWHWTTDMGPPHFALQGGHPMPACATCWGEGMGPVTSTQRLRAAFLVE